MADRITADARTYLTDRVVDLSGTTMTGLLSVIPVIAEQTGRAVVLVGGLAVICRLPTPYRATSDLDTVDRRAVGERPQLELLIAAGGTPSGPSGVVIQTHVGDVQVDVLQVTDAELEELPESIMNRGAAKEGTDLLDILRLSLDRECGPISRRGARQLAVDLRQSAASPQEGRRRPRRPTANKRTRASKSG